MARDIWSPEKIREVIQAKFPDLSPEQDIESQLSSIETVELLLALEKSLGVQLQAIELEPVLQGNLPLFCQIVNDKI